MLKTYTTKSRIFQRQEVRKQRRRKRRKNLILTIFLVSIAISIVYIGNLGGQKISKQFDEMKYPVKYSEYITKYSRENNLDPYLVIALIKQV